MHPLQISGSRGHHFHRQDGHDLQDMISLTVGTYSLPRPAHICRLMLMAGFLMLAKELVNPELDTDSTLQLTFAATYTGNTV